MSEKRRVPVIPAHLKLLNEEGTEGTLLGTRCRQCGEHFFGSVVFCQQCTSADLEPVELSSRGTLYSYTIVHRPPAGWEGNVPYALGQVQLPEGPQVLSEVVDCPFDRLKVGMMLELALVVGSEDAQGNEIVVYKWRLAGPSSG
jgi:uncharacterized OB-fold protein